MSWFRFYETALDDPKVQRLPPDVFKGWVNLLCLAQRHNGSLPSIPDIAFALRLSEMETVKLLTLLANADLFDETETGYSPHNWNGRQYKTDVSTERVKRFRERSAKRDETVSETTSETPPDTEQNQIQNRTELEPATVVAPASPPAKQDFGDPELLAIPKTLKRKARMSRLDGEFVIDEDSERYRYARGLGMTDADMDIECDKFENHHRAKGSLMADWDAAWRTWCRNWQTFSQKRRA